MQKGVPVKIPVTVDLHIRKFASGLITDAESGSKNIVIGQFKDGRWYATQRPGINQLENASATVTDMRGRGGYYWDAVSEKYICNANKIYKTSYAGTPMTITTGTCRVFMSEVGDYLVIIDSENNQGWYILNSAPSTINAITSPNFPPNQTPALQLAREGAVLNGKVYVMTTGGDIYESDVEDPTTWGALNFRNAELEPDGGVVLTKHHQHIVALGYRTTEFFDDVGNATGSTLGARTDISYDAGAVNYDTIAHVGEQMFFVGQDKSGSVGVYMLDNYTLTKISKNDMDTFLTSSIITDEYGVIGSGFVSGGRNFYVVTLYTSLHVTTDITPVITLVYVSTRQWWGLWDVQLPDVDFFPLISWMPSTSNRAGEGVLVNGDLITVIDDFNPVDGVASQQVYEADVFESGIYVSTAASSTTIPFEVITGEYDGESPRIKKQGDMWLMHSPLVADETVTIAVNDDEDTAYQSGRTLSVKSKDARINRNGSFRERNYKINGDLSETIRMEHLETTVRLG